MNTDDEILLREYVDTDSEQAFSSLVERHVDLVTRIVRSRIPDGESGHDVVQVVFSLLARKAKSLLGHSALAGWLVKTAVFESKKHIRREVNRMKRESSHVELEEGIETENPFSEEDYAIVDEAITRLPERFRVPLLMRYYEKESFKTIGARIGKSDGAAQKQVSRAVERLRVLVGRRAPEMGTTTAIFSAILAASLTPGTASAGNANALAVAALQSSSPLSFSTFIANTIYTMTATQLKFAALVAVAAAIPIAFQWNQNNELKDRLSETQTVAAPERLGLQKRLPVRAASQNTEVIETSATNDPQGSELNTASLLERFDRAAVSGGRRSEEWRSAIKELRAQDPAQLLRLLAEIQEADYGTLARRDAAHVVIGELSRKDPQAAAEYILQNQGSEALGATLKEWAQNAPDEAMGWLVAKLRAGELNPKDTSSSSHGNPFSDALSGVAIVDPAKALSTWAAVPHEVDANSLAGVVSSLRTPAIREAFVAELQNISDPGRAGIAAEAYAQGLGKHLGIAEAKQEIDSLDLTPEAKNWAIVRLATEGISHGGDAAVGRANWLLENSIEEYAADNAAAISSSWARSDFNGVAEWLPTIENVAHRDAAIAGFTSAISTMEPESALRWAAEINAPDLRSSVQRSISEISQENTP